MHGVSPAGRSGTSSHGNGNRLPGQELLRNAVCFGRTGVPWSRDLYCPGYAGELATSMCRARSCVYAGGKSAASNICMSRETCQRSKALGFMYQISTTTIGALCAASAVMTTALYQLWAGSQQRALDASSAQLLHQSSPYAAGLLAILVAVFEPVMPGSDPGRGETCLHDEHAVLYVCA